MPALGGAVVQDAAIRQGRVTLEKDLHDQLLGPSRPVPHRADHDVVVDRHRRVAGEEQIGHRREGVAALVERGGQWTRPLLPPFDQRPHQRLRRQVGQFSSQRRGGYDVRGLADQQFAHLGAPGDVGQEVPDPIHRGESLEYRHEPPVFALRGLEVDDVVVQKVLARPGRDREQLRARRVYQYGTQASDLAADMDGHPAS